MCRNANARGRPAGVGVGVGVGCGGSAVVLRLDAAGPQAQQGAFCWAISRKKLWLQAAKANLTQHSALLAHNHEAALRLFQSISS